MPSRVDPCVRTLILAVALAAASSAAVLAQAGDDRAAAVVDPASPEIDRAIERVKADPNLATERTIKTLRWKRSTDPQPAPRIPAWLTWIAGLVRWMEQISRVLVWGAVAIMVAALIVFLVNLVNRRRSVPTIEDLTLVPTHVHHLDIRPESLPDDVGAAARRMWDRGEHRASLALLYRGLLSRLAHVHHVPIRDSSTEGDCLSLANRHLTEARRQYVARLVRVWQRAVYGAEDAQSSTVYRLCDDFASALDRAASFEALPERTS